MRYRRLTDTGDYSFGSSAKDFLVDSPETVGQAVQTRILLFYGEWFLDIEIGTRLLQGIMGKHSKELADQTIRERILTTQGVVSIQSYDSTLDENARNLSVNCTINTIYGVTAVEVENYGNF